MGCRDTDAKLELLYRKNLYPVAISLAYASHHDVGKIMDIYRLAEACLAMLALNVLIRHSCETFNTSRIRASYMQSLSFETGCMATTCTRRVTTLER